MSADIFSLSGRTALVTGAASGLGRSIALAVAQCGAATVVADIDPTVGETAQAIDDAGGHGFAFTADLTQPDAVAALAREVGAVSGGLDILINNAGIAIAPARLLDVSVEDWDRVISANLRSVFLVSKAMLPMLLRSAHASVINISSFLGLVGAYPGFPVTAVPYAASKAGIDGFTRQVAMEYAKDGLRVNAVARRAGMAARGSAVNAGQPRCRKLWTATSPTLARRSRWDGAARPTSSPASSFTWRATLRATSPGKSSLTTAA